MKVGDFVRLRSDIVRANGHLALTGDKGLLVSFTDETKRIAHVVWQDGDHGTFRVKDLARTVGDIGTAMTDRNRKPLRDRGRGKVAPWEPKPLPPAVIRKAVWAIVEEKEVKGFPLEPKNPGDNPRFMRFAVPLTVVEVRATEWPTGMTIKLSRSEKSITVTFPNGERSSLTPTAARVFLSERFRGDIIDTLRTKLRV